MIAALFAGQGKIKRSPFSWCRFSPYFATVLVNYFINYCKPYTSSFKFFCIVQPLEDPEEFTFILFIKSNPVVPYGKYVVSVVSVIPYFYDRVFGSRRIFHGIAHQINPHLPE